ncbi:PAS domain S-box-containing protein [Catalinimonas alkaloidigena]|uniref:PAS domain S-box-containing protein n=1 Tax=Catalinimonas alkaloidigena TaxID=1075417 RepID=A0A1G8XL79_9BACT|nr:SpoIIE family protein phosphatase [Catalinimonas alkaloidigena]SDJ91321.1 PAS domain S-box-containing protein [Catalinimonas alkaloidigena]
MALVSLDGQIQFVNHAFGEAFAMQVATLNAQGGMEVLCDAALFDRVCTELQRGAPSLTLPMWQGTPPQEYQVEWSALYTPTGQLQHIQVTWKRQEQATTITLSREHLLKLDHIRTLILSSDNLICELTADGAYSYVSDSVTTLLGYQPKELLGKTVYDFMHPEDLIRVQETAAKSLAAQEPMYREVYRLLHQSGEYVWVETSTRLRFYKGTVTSMVSSMRSVDQQKKLERRLRESEQLYRTVARHYPNGSISLIEPDYRVTFIDGQELSQGGLKQHAFLNHTVFDLFNEGHDTLREQLARAFAGEAVSFDLKQQDQHFTHHLVPVFDEHEEVAYLLDVAHNITDRVKVSEAVETQRQYLRQIIDAVPSPIFVRSTEGVLLLANQAVADRLGRSIHELENNTDWLAEYDPNQITLYLEFDQQALQQQRTVSREETVTDAHGEIRHYLTIKKALHLPSGEQQILSVATDITALKQSENELRDKNEVLNIALAHIEKEDLRKTQQLEEARQLQRAIIPRRVPQTTHLDLVFYQQPALEVGGDYFDYAQHTDRDLTLVLGDVTGHGMRSSLLGVMVKSYFQTLASQHDTPQVMQQIHRAIRNLNLRGMYMGLQLLRITDYTLSLTTAAMPPLLWYHARTQEISTLIRPGLFLGVQDDQNFIEEQHTLESGDLLIALTDGLLERFNADGQIFGLARLKQVILTVADQTPEAIKEHLLATNESWGGNATPHDDITFLVVRMR